MTNHSLSGMLSPFLSCLWTTKPLLSFSFILLVCLFLNFFPLLVWFEKNGEAIFQKSKQPSQSLGHSRVDNWCVCSHSLQGSTHLRHLITNRTKIKPEFSSLVITRFKLGYWRVLTYRRVYSRAAMVHSSG